jgi:hypothetical protein
MKRYWENLRPFEKRVVVGVATMVFAVFNLWFVLPHFSDLAKMKTRMQDARWALGIRQVAIAQAPIHEAEINRLQKEGADVPAEDQVLQFQHTVTDEEMKSGVRPGSAGRTITTTNQFFLEQSQTITVQSGEQQLVDFLYNLGAGNSLIRVRELQLHPDAQTHQELTATIKIVASFQKNPTSKPGAPAGKPGSTRLAGTPPPTGRPATPSPAKSSNPPPQPGKNNR